MYNISVGKSEGKASLVVDGENYLIAIKANEI
jgi:hypothetical protein